jgi:hypothetical protein
MAAIFIVAGLAIADKVEKKKEAKRLKKARDEQRYRELQIETNCRLARTKSGNVIENTFIDDPEHEGNVNESEEQLQSSAVDDAPPPAYEDAVTVGERRERQWQEQMQRRRSSVHSETSGNARRGSTNVIRAG